MRARAVAALPTALALAGALAIPAAAQERGPRVESIRADQMRSDLFFLAGDAFRGRLTNTPGNTLAAEWIKARFERLGLEPAAGQSYFQEYDLMAASVGEGNRLVATLGNGVVLQPLAQRAFYPHRYSANASATGPLVFAGFGMTSPALGYDDYRGNAVRGSVVLVLDHEPGENDPASPFDGVLASQASAPLEKALAAQAKGAVGILLVRDVHNHPGAMDFAAQARFYWPAEPPAIERYTLAAWSDRVHIPVLQVSPVLAEQLVARSGRSLVELARAAETARGSSPVPIPNTRIEMTAAVVQRVVPDRNVVALLEGSDPKLKDEWIIIGAHLDGNGDQGNAADDNASGVAALLDIAEAYALGAQAGQRPRRSILFKAWNSEERGLLGSWAYTEAPLHSLEQTVAVLNMDMIGRNEEVPVGGGGRFRGLEVQTAESNANAVNIVGYSRAPELAAVVERSNAGIGLRLKKVLDPSRSNLLRRSDQWPFLQHGVPAVNLTTGLHPDYHNEYDIPEKINYEKMERIARLVYLTSWELAQQDGRPRMPTTTTAR